jgi:hypothetical protein
VLDNLPVTPNGDDIKWSHAVRHREVATARLIGRLGVPAWRSRRPLSRAAR